MKDKKSREIIYDRIIKLEKAICSISHRILSELDLTSSQAQTLYTIQDGLTIKKLADALFISSSAATQLVETLENKKMIKRIHSDSDRRVVNVKLTKNGQVILLKLMEKRQLVTDALLRNLNDKEIKELAKIYDKMVTGLLEKRID